jgi:hypothetical protein
MKTTLPPEELSFNDWSLDVHIEASQIALVDLPYIVTPRVNHSHLERVLNARN